MSGDEPRDLTEDERLDWLRLIRSENVGPVTFHQLLERFGGARTALEALPDLARRGGRRDYRAASVADAEKQLAATVRAGARLIAIPERAYPPLLRAIPDAPPLVAVMGHAHLLARPTVAIVGARNASANGRAFAKTLAADLGRRPAGGDPLVIVSGLARGIDTAAHEGAIESGTIAVVAGGLDQVYPPENADLQRRIAEQGAVVAEQPIGTQPKGRLFPLRNRLISGLSLGVVVVEASPKSGSLITARRALDQGREVFAVPGAPGDPRTAGANGLIRDGAWLTENADDVSAQLPSLGKLRSENQISFVFKDKQPTEDDGLTAREALDEVAGLLGFSPVTVDELVRNCQLSLASVTAALLDLELAGRLERLPGNRVQLLRSD